MAFRKKIYESLDQLQVDLDKYLNKYNYERTHQGKMCCGRTPWQTFLAGKEIVNNKIINGEFTKEDSRRNEEVVREKKLQAGS